MKINVIDMSNELRGVFPSYKKSQYIKIDLVDAVLNVINNKIVETDYLQLGREINRILNSEDNVI